MTNVDEQPEPEPESARTPIPRDLVAFWNHYRGYHRSVFVAGGVSGAAAVSELLLLATVATIVSAMGEEGKGPAVLGHRLDVTAGALLVVAVALVLIRLALALSEVFLAARLGSRYEREQRARILGAFLDADWPTQSAQRGNEAQDVVTGAVMYGRVGLKAMASSVGSLCSTAIMVAGALAMSWIATLASIILSFLLAVTIQPIVRRSKAVGAAVRDGSFEYVTAFGEAVTMAREIRLAGVGKRFTERLDEIGVRIEAQRTREQLLLGAAPRVFETGAFLIVLAGLGALYYLDVGNTARFIAMLVLLLRASQYGQSLQSTYHQAKASLPYLEVIDERLSTFQASAVTGGSRRVADFRVLELQDVSYCYDSHHFALNGVSLSIERGDIIGIIGPSGSGKTTLVDILLGLRTPIGGDYLIDGQSFRETDPHTWHEIAGLVTQEPQLIEGDLRDNIRFLRESVTETDIADAVRDSGLGRDVASLPDGLETRIGPRSSGLSGGQRQRLSIARVLAGHPQILVLDEPTSALDVHAETVVTDTLDRLKGTITIVVVAHRLSTLRVCDKVAVIRGGVLEHFGDRAALERDSDYYSSAVDLAQIAR